VHVFNCGKLNLPSHFSDASTGGSQQTEQQQQQQQSPGGIQGVNAPHANSYDGGMEDLEWQVRVCIRLDR